MATGSDRHTMVNRDHASGSAALNRRSFLRASTVAGGLALAGCLGEQEERDGISVGVLLPSPPDENPVSLSMRNGAQLAVDELSESDDLITEEIDLVVESTNGQPSTGQRVHEQLTRGEDPVDMTTGIFTSEVLMAVMDGIADSRTPHFTTGANTPAASELVHDEYDRYKYHFRTGLFNSHYLGESMADFADGNFEQMGWDSIAVLIEDYEWTIPVAERLNERLEDADVEVVMDERYAAGTDNFDPIYDEIESEGADGAYICMAHTGVPAVLQWAQQNRSFGFGGIHIPLQYPNMYEDLDGAPEGAFTQNFATPTTPVTEKTEAFGSAYVEEFGQEPVFSAYTTYDAVYSYATAVQEVGSTDADEVVAALEDQRYTGTVGNIEYADASEPNAHDTVYGPDNVYGLYAQWQDGEQIPIFPEELATSSYQGQ